MTNFAALLEKAQTVQPTRQRKNGSSRNPQFRMEYSTNGPRMFINAALKRKLHEAGHFGSAVEVEIFDRRNKKENDIVFFFEVLESATDNTVTVNTPYDKDGRITSGSYVNGLQSIANGVADLEVQELYGEWGWDDIHHVEGTRKYAVIIPSKTDEELESLIQQDEAKKASKKAASQEQDA